MTTDDEVMQALRELVAEKGEDYVYEPPGGEGYDCCYVHEDEHGRKSPGCLVGRAAVRLGVSLPALEALEGKGASDVMKNHFPSTSRKLWMALNIGQAEQDEGAPWGEALRVIEAEMGN